MTLPSLLRRTPFRLTLLFLALFAAAASAILGYVYFASASEARTAAEQNVRGEMQVLRGVYDQRGFDALNRTLIDRSLTRSSFLYLLVNEAGEVVTGSLSALPIAHQQQPNEWTSLPFT